jgi:hypothetical protein
MRWLRDQAHQMETTDLSNKAGLEEQLFPHYSMGVVALICAATLIVLALLGPLGMGAIVYRTSQSAVWQIMGNDLVNLLLIAPLLLIGGVLELQKRNASKYFLILTPIALIYAGLSEGIGQEWNNPAYTGNVETYSWLFMVLVTGGLFLIIGTMSKFNPSDAPSFDPKSLKKYVAAMSLFLSLFALMWASELAQVITTGNTTTGSYSAAPTSWWVVRYLDLCITIPVGFMALFLLLTKPKKAYSLILLFFGFFITTGAAVNAMALVMILNNDPSIGGANAGGLVIFPVLGVLTFAGLYYLVKDKIGTRGIKGVEA